MSKTNKVQLIGFLGKDPELKELENGQVVNFTVATDDSYKNKAGEKVQQVDWHNCSAFGAIASMIAKFFKKGDGIILEGKIKTRSYDDKDGNKRYVTEINVNDVTFLPVRKSGGNDTVPSNEVSASDDESDPLPF